MYEQFIIGALKSIGLFGGLGISGTLLYKTKKIKKTEFIGDLHQTIEDRSCGTMIIGVPGSGKTYFAVDLFLEDVKRGYGALWLTTQGIFDPDILNYIPPKRVNKTILLQPHKKRSRGMNMFKRYTGTQLERSLIADNTVILFKRMFDTFTENMKSIISASVIALLEYSEKKNIVVCLWDLYEFLKDKNFRKEVIECIDNIAARDMLEDIEDSNTQKSVNAILKRFRTMLYNDNMLAFLSQKEDDIDLLDAVRKRKVIICDFYAGGVGEKEALGQDNANFLAELMVTRMELIAQTRKINDSLYPIYLDEFGSYTTSADNIQKFIYLHRKKRMPPTLIFQSRQQLNTKDLKSAVDSVGTKYIFKLEPNDFKIYRDMYPQYKEKIDKNMACREGISDIRSGGKNYDIWIKTPDLEGKYNLGYVIEERNKGKYTVQEIIKKVTKKPVIEREDDFQ